MASDSRALTLKLLADVADYQRKLADSEKTTDGFSGKVQEFGKKAAAAFAVAGAAAAAYAGKLLIEGVRAAIADEAAQTRLASALRNATDATEAQIKSTEDYITKTSIAFGVTDEDLRPSLQRLAIATEDVTKAQNLQRLALDIAAGSGKSLETVSNALARAYEGNTTSLGRLGIGLSAAQLKTMSFDQVTESLAATFKDQASIQADTFQGKLTRLQIGFDEAKEALGSRLIPILTNFLTIVTDKIIPGIQSLLAKFEPLTTAVKNNESQFRALWDFLSKYIIPIVTGALKLAFSGFVSGLTAVVNGIANVVKFFQNLYDIAKKVIDLLKNNPLSNLLGKLNPFSNSETSSGATFSNVSFGNSDALIAGGATDTGTTNATSEQGNIYTVNGRRIIVPPWIPDSEKQAYAERLDSLITKKEENIARTDELRKIIEGRKSGSTSSNTGSNVIINVGVAGDPEGTARTIREIFTDSFNRGTGGLVGAF